MDNSLTIDKIRYDIAKNSKPKQIKTKLIKIHAWLGVP